MGANNLKVSSSDLREYSSTFGKPSSELGSVYQSISKNAENLANVWGGVASQKFYENIKSTYTTFEKAVQYLDEVSKNLTTAANNYDEVERQNSVG